MQTNDKNIIEGGNELAKVAITNVICREVVKSEHFFHKK